MIEVPTVDPGVQIYKDARQKWMNDNPGKTEFAFELISPDERNWYMFEEMKRAGFSQGMKDGLPYFYK